MVFNFNKKNDKEQNRILWRKYREMRIANIKKYFNKPNIQQYKLIIFLK